MTDNHASDAIPLSSLFADLDDEFALTRRILEHYPDDADPDWTPHERSMSLIGLAGHIAQLPGLGLMIAGEAEWNMETKPYVPPSARNRAELLALFDATSAAARRATRALDAASLDDPWRMRQGDIVFFEGARGALLRRFLISHTAHHRGQLTVFYRLLGVRVPGLYGPSADEMG